VVQDVEEPKPANGQVLVAVKGSGVCHHDVINRNGGFPRTVFPAILGHEIAGEIVDVGSGVSVRAVAQSDVPAGRREPARGGRADAPAPAGDEDGFRAHGPIQPGIVRPLMTTGSTTTAVRQ